MNKIFKVIWNHATQSWIVTSEISKSHGKTASSKSGGFAISHISGVRFAYTAIASTLLFVLSETTLAATVADGTGTNSIIIKGATSTATAIGADSLAAGTNAAANGKSAVAIGTNSEATGENATAYGNMAKATKNNATAFGSLSQATAQSATAVGDGAQAIAGQTTAVGVTTVASSAGATAVGHKSQATADHATALGSIANASAARTVAVGYNVTASQIDAVAVGSNAIANQAYAVAVGVNAKAQNNSNIAIGNLANATGATSAISIGRESVASNTSTVAMGYKAQASGTSAIAVGSGSLASGISAIAIGNGSDAAGERTTVIGSRNGNVAASYSAIVGIGNAITSTTDVQVYGNTNTISRSNTYVLGSNNTVSGATESAVIAGRENTMSGTNGVAVGRLNTVAGSSAVAIGQSSQALGTDGIALGNKAYANTGQNAIALGGLTHAGQFGTALGARTSVEGDQGAAVATGAVVKGARAVAVGSYSFAGTEDSVALGHNTAATGSRAVAIGAGSVVSGARSGAWGIATDGGAPDANKTDRSFVGGADSYAIGNKNIIGNTSSDSFVLGNNVKLGATGASIAITDVAGKDSTTNASTRTNAVTYTGATAITGAVALGSDTSVTVNNGVALGKSSVAGTAAGQTGADPLNAATDKTTSTWKATHAAVSVGNGTNVTRQITSVAAGTQDTDAVNVAQLKAAGFTLAASNTGGGESTTVANDKIQNGETVTVDAGKNIKVTHTANQVSIATKDDVAFTTVTTTDATTGNKTVLNGTGITITPTGGGSTVSLTNVGLNNGGNTITNVADGSIASGSKEAINGGQLYTIDQKVIANTTNIDKGLNFAGNSGTFNRKLGEKTTISGGLTDTTKSASNTNIRTVATNGTIDIQLANAPVFTGKVSAQGLDAGNQRITGVQAGQSGTDAVNVGQLNTAIANVANTTQTVINQNSLFSYIATVNGAKVALLRSVDEAGDVHFVLADGSNTPYTGDVTDVTISALNPNEPQLAIPTTVGNIADGKADNDAVNVRQLKNAVTALGAGAAVNADGSIKKPSYTVKSNTFDNVGGAIDALDEAVQKPLTFSGDNATEKVVRQLDTELAVKGGSTANLTEGNIGVVGNATNNSLTIKLAEKINLGTAGSVTTGDTKVDNAGVTITSTSTGKTPVSLTNAGLDNGGNVISNVGAGKADTDAVNVSQLTPLATALGVNVDPNSGIVAAPSFVVTKTDGSTYAGATTIQGALNNIGTEIQKGITFVGNSGQTVKKLGETFNIKGTLDSTATASDKNIRTEVDGNGVMSIKLAESPKFGNVTINDAGKITGVTAGTADTDAVNVAQLNAKTATTPLIVGNTGAVDTPADTSKLATAGDIADAINQAGFTLTTATTTDGELGATATNELINAGDTVTVEADKNIKVTQTSGKISIATKDDVNFNSVTAGTGTNAVVLDNNGVSVGGKTYISDAGLNANDKKITNVANGDVSANSKDAINGSQLHAVSTATKNLIGSSATVNPDGTVTASNIGGTGANTIDDAIKTVKTTVKSTDNTIKVTANTANANDGTVFDISVDAQKLAESAQLPVVYTDADGNKVYKVGGKFTKDPTGQDATQEVTATNVIASMQNADGTTSTATKLANIAKGEVSSTSKDAINGSQLFAQGEGVKNIIGGNTTYNPSTGAYENNDIGGTGKGNINDAIQTINTKADTNATEIAKGLNFGANDQTATSNTAINRKLGDTIGIKGGITDTSTATSGENVITRTDANGNINIELAKNAKFDSVTTGGTKLSDAGLSFVDASGSPVANSPSISKTGINAGNQAIAGVKAGTNDSDAVNVSQLKGAVDALGGGAAINSDGTITAPTYNITNPADGKVTTANNVGDALDSLNDAVNSPLTFKGDSGEFNRNLGQTTTVKGGITDTAKLSDNNIGVVAKDGTLDIKLAKDIAVDSVKAGDTTVNTYGVSIANADPNKVVSLTDSGLNNGNNRITNVAAGQAGTDAVNKDQLDAAKASATTKVVEGKNVKVTGQLNNDGSTTYTVATADEVAFDKATVGNVTIDSTTNKISGLANGDVSANSTDAINGSQLFATNQNVANNTTAIASNAAQIAKGINFGGTTGSNNYALGNTINVKGDSNISSETVAGGVQLKLNDVVSIGTAKPVKIDGTNGTVGGLTNTTWDANNIVSGQAATEDQLKSAVTAAQAAATTKVANGKNIKVAEQTNADGSKTYTVATADDLDVTSIKAGDTTINNAGVTVGDKVALTNTGLTAGDVKVSTDGINAGNKVITGVAAGTKDTDAVNVKQLNDQLTATEKTTTAQAGSDKVTVTGTTTGNNTDYVIDLSKDAKASLAKADTALQNVVSNDSNLTVSKNGDTVTLDFSDVPVFAGVTAGTGANQVVLDDKGVNVGGKTYISDAGLNANDKKITNVAAGTVAKDSKDAINGSQLFAQGEGVKNIIGGNTTYDPATGTYTNNNIGGTGKGNINDAIQAINNTANAGWNVQTNGGAKTNIKPTDTVNFINGKNIKVTNEGANITVATADDLDVTSVKAGNTTINNSGVTVGDKVALTDSGLSAGNVKVTTDGINAGGNKITGVAAGDISATSTDAVNGSQLNAVNQRILNIIGGKDDGYYDANGNLTEAGQLALKTYNVQGQSEFVHNSVVSAIKKINEQGTKFFHTNEGQSFTSEATNSEDSSAGGKYSTAIGYQAATTAAAANGLAVGTQSKAAGENAVALGYQAQANGTNTISIGTGNVVNGNNSGAIGDPSVIDGANSYSVGNNNSIAASSDNVFILGNDVNIAANTSGAVALGNKASVTTAGSVALGEGSTAGAANIAGGTANNAYTFGAYNDANVAAKPTTSTSVVAVGSKGNERQIQHVAAGVVSATSTDAINGSQLYYTNRALGKLADVVNKNNLDLRAGVAGANAAAGLPQVYLPGKSMVAASAGTYRGQSALAVGYSRSSDNGKLVLKVQGNANTRGEVGGSVGIGYQW